MTDAHKDLTQLRAIIARYDGFGSTQAGVPVTFLRKLEEHLAAYLSPEFELFERADEGKLAPLVFARLVRAESECAIIDEAVAQRKRLAL